MRDLPLRAARAEAEITQLAGGDLATSGPYDLVLVDAPCSGSGSWRRAPEAKWTLTPDQLVQTTQRQDAILDAAAALVTAEGTLAYATCSILPDENGARVQAFLRTDRFERNLPLQGFVETGVDLPHPAATDQLLDREGAQFLILQRL